MHTGCWRLATLLTCLAAMGCASHKRPVETGRTVEPQNYILMESFDGWGDRENLRIVDWGGEAVHAYAVDDEQREKEGYLTRDAFRELADELVALGALDLEDYHRQGVWDATNFNVHVSIDGRRNSLSIYCPWTNGAGQDESPGMVVFGVPKPPEDASSARPLPDWAPPNMTAEEFFAAVDGSKPHEELVNRLLAETEKDYLQWETMTRSFTPRRELLNAGGRDVVDAYFTDEGELLYGVEFVEWEEEDFLAYVTWYSADGDREPVSLPFEYESVPAHGGDQPYPRPTPRTVVPYPEVRPDRWDAEGAELVRGTYCGGRVGLYIPESDSLDLTAGLQLTAYLLEHPSAYCPVLEFEGVPTWQWGFQVDISPDGRRATWLDRGLLYTADAITDCAAGLEWLEFAHQLQAESESRHEAKKGRPKLEAGTSDGE